MINWKDEVEPAKTTEKRWTAMARKTKKCGFGLGQNQVKTVFCEGARDRLHQMLPETEQDELVIED